MTDVSRWLVGLVGITGVPVLFFTLMTVRGQIKSGGVTWKDSAPTRIGLCLIFIGLSIALFMVAAIFSSTSEPKGIQTYMVWGAWFSAWVGAMIGLSGIRKDLVPVVASLNVLWTIFIWTWVGYFS